MVRASFRGGDSFVGVRATGARSGREIEEIHAEMQSPEVVSDGPRLHTCYQKLQGAEARVEALYARWAELEGKQQ